MLSIIGIFATLILLMVLVFKKVNIVVVSILCAAILAVMDGSNIISVLIGPFMEGFGGYVTNFFLLFFVSALFGKVMEESGAAAAIAKYLVSKFGKKYTVVAVIIACAVLAYGGISALVIAFTMYPIALAMFKEGDYPRYLIPGAIAAGAFDVVPGSFPGTPQTVNAVASQYLGTSLSAAPVLGIICGVIGMGLILIYMHREGVKAKNNNEHFKASMRDAETLEKAEAMGDNVNPFIAFVPLILIIMLLIILEVNVVVAMFAGTLACYVLLYKNVKDKNLNEMLTTSVKNASNAAINTGAIVGYGSVVSASAGFDVLINWLTNLGGSPLLTYGLSTTIISGAAGSGTGGLAIALETIAPRYLQLGLNPEVIHRVGTISAVGIDSLPHNGAVVALLSLSGMTHKDSYKQIFVTTVLIAVVVMFIAIFLGTIMYT